MLEEKYWTIFESANDAIFIMKDGRLIDCNEKTLELFECDRDDIIGETPFEFSPKKQPDGRSSKEKGMEKINSVLEGEAQKFEWVHTTKDGEPFHTEVTLNQYTIDDEKFVMAIVRDITDRKKAKKELKEREEKFRALVESAFAGITMTDFDDNLNFVNDRFAEMLGYEKDELIGKNVKEISPEKEHPKYEKETEKRKKGEISQYETRLKKKNGEIIDVMVYGSPFKDAEGEFVGTIGVVTDITDRKKREERIMKNKEKIENLQKISAELETRKSAKEVYGHTVDVAERILDFDICAINIPKGEVMEEVASSSEFPEEASSKNNTLPLDDSLAGKAYRTKRSFLVRDKKNNDDVNPISPEFRSGITVPIGELAVFQAFSAEIDDFDEDDLRMTELLMDHVSEALERVKAKEREDFLHSLLRHDVRNKNQIIKGYLELMKDYDLSEEAIDFLEKAEHAAEDSIEIIERVRKLRKIEEEEEIGKVDMSLVFDRVLSEQQGQLEENNINIHISDFDCKVKGGKLLEELFSNLIENSIKHSGCDEIKISSRIEDDECVVSVKDDGIGIKDEVKKKIFEKGFKKGEAAGTGLGLFMVKEIAENYDGSVEVKDSEMGGAMFEVRLEINE